MIRAVWNGAVLAEATRTVRLEGNDYFPPQAIRREFLSDSTATSSCWWKGTAHYYTVTVNDQVNPDAGWYNPHPSPRARHIKNHVAFWHGVHIERDDESGTSTGGRTHAVEEQAMSKPLSATRSRLQRFFNPDALPMWRIGISGGLVGILCCLGPTVLALLGIISAGTAFVWANDLYANYAWWFRLGGVAVLGVLVWVSLKRRDQCSLAGVRQRRWRLLGVLVIAVVTYVALYAVTTWLGGFA